LLSALPISGSAGIQNNDIKADTAKAAAERGEAAQRSLAAQRALNEDKGYLSNRLASITDGKSTERYRGEAADLRAALALNQKAGAELQQVSSAAEKLSRATSAGATSSLDGLADSARFYLKATGTDGVALMMSTQQGAEAFATPALAEQTSAAAAAQPASASFDASGSAQRAEFGGNRANLTSAATGPAGVANVYAGSVNPSQAAANGFDLPGDGAGPAGSASGVPGFAGPISAPAAPGGQRVEAWVRDQQEVTVTEQGSTGAAITTTSTNVTDARGEVGREATDRIEKAREGARATPTPTPEER
jgi:hypothetical protein